MAQNFLYMFEFVVDNLLVTRMNKCAPEEYPTCCEISFRSSVYVTICDREYGRCIDACTPKCGKCCLFSLESPINNKDRLLIHVYKKRNDSCKFLLGATEMPIKPLFDKVTDDFDSENQNWMEAITRHHATMPDPKVALGKRPANSDSNIGCDDDHDGRREQFCQTSEVSKGLLPLYNMKGVQTGNITLIVRLVCNGPAIVTISNYCPPVWCGKKTKQRQSKSGSTSKTCCSSPAMPDPCKRGGEPGPQCRRYFACNIDKGCPCRDCEDDMARECFLPCKSKKSKNGKKTPSCPPSCSSPCPPSPCRSCGGADCCDDFCDDDCNAEESCSDDDDNSNCQCCPIEPCFVTPTKPDPGRDAYEEYQACLNGSGLTIRVLKDTHQMESIIDGTEGKDNLQDSESLCDFDNSEKPKTSSNRGCDSQCGDDCDTLHKLLHQSKYVQRELRRRTAGHIVNNPKIPKVRANIKYAGADTGCLESYRVPFTNIKNACQAANKVDLYRKKGGEDCCGCGPIDPPIIPDDTRSCCLQVDPEDIKAMLGGINVDARKKGIEVCYKTCDDNDSDIFMVKLGGKKACEHKKHSIEIELRTPKVPVPCPVQKCTTETQIDEIELDAAFSKGKGGKKGKGKKK